MEQIAGILGRDFESSEVNLAISEADGDAGVSYCLVVLLHAD